MSTQAGQAVAAGRMRAPRPGAAERLSRAASKLTLPVILLLPAMTIIVGLVGYPLVKTVWLSFTDTRLGDLIDGTSTWVGPRELQGGLRRRAAAHVVVNTVVFGTACVVGTMALGMAVALLLNQRLRFNWFCSLAVLLPWAVPGAGRQLDLRWLFDDRTASSTGRWSGSASRLPGLRLVRRSQQRLRRRSFVVVVWQSFPFIALSLLAGLQIVPRGHARRRRASTAPTPSSASG